MNKRVLAPGAYLASLLLLCVSGCKVDRETFHAKLFSCNPNAADPACGTDIDDNAMACVAAYQLGGQNFCATGCDRKKAPPDGDNESICLPSGPENAGDVSGALLKKCNPVQSDGSCGHAELSCLRTDLIKPEGVCMNVTPCQSNADCRDPVRSVCMGQLLKGVYGDKAGLKPDHTYCLQFGCNATGAACSPGESCLRKLIGRESTPSDICVPNCDSNRNCPPNYFCYPDLYSKPSPAICLPGLMGLRCRTRLDCLFGDCVATEGGFNVCTTSCKSDADCEKFDSEHGTFFCNDKGYCAGVRAFRGSLCYATSDCRKGEICSRPFFTPETQDFGQCLFPCDTEGKCTAYGGVAHACIPQKIPGPPICWPGHVNMICQRDDECVKGLKCLTAQPPSMDNPRGTKICSVSCTKDEDCQANHQAKDDRARDSWCNTKNNLCFQVVKEGQPCERNTQCESQQCITKTIQDANGMMVPHKECGPLPPW